VEQQVPAFFANNMKQK